jgi:murein L,D-transpeptidase YafK
MSFAKSVFQNSASYCLVAISAIVPVALGHAETQPAQAANPLTAEVLYPEGLIAISPRPEFSKNIFLVDQTRRILRVYQYENGLPRLIQEFPSDLGKRAGEKRRENDHRTPVGIYFLQQKKTQPEIPFSLYGTQAFTTDYPNIFDRRDAKTGSGIWLHAVPDNVPLTRGSRGCVVVRNNVIKELGQFVHLRQTPLVIFDQMKELSLADYQKQRATFLGFVETWRSAWEKEDIETYMKFYDPTFFNSDMNYDQWFAHKKRLKGIYQYIQVQFSEPLIVRNRDQVVIRMLQLYKSDRHQDFGEKTMHAHYSEKNGFRIVREDWKPMKIPADWAPAGGRTATIERTLSNIEPGKSDEAAAN